MTGSWDATRSLRGCEGGPALGLEGAVTWRDVGAPELHRDERREVARESVRKAESVSGSDGDPRVPGW